MIFPIRPTTTEARRIDEVKVRAIPAVTGITAAHGFNQPGVVVTIGDGARSLARFGQESQSGNPAASERVSVPPEEATSENVFGAAKSPTGTEAVFKDGQGKALPSAEADSERLAVDGEQGIESVWGSDTQPDDVDVSGVPYAALQRAATVQDLDVNDVAQALAHTQIAVRVLATEEQPSALEGNDPAQTQREPVAHDAADTGRGSTLPTDGVPYEALQRAVTEAENAQNVEAQGETEPEAAEVDGSPTQPVFMPPENGGAPWGRAVPFEDDSQRSVSVEHAAAPTRKERVSEAQARA